MFSVKTSSIMKNLKPGRGNAAASAVDSNNKEFARFAAKAKVSPELVKAAFTNRGLNHADGTFAFSGKEMNRLKDYVSTKLENRDLKPGDQERLLKVVGAFVNAVQVRLNAAATQAFSQAGERRQQPAARNQPAPIPPQPADVQAPGTRIFDIALKRILARVVEADTARATMQSATEHHPCISAKLKAQRLYRQAAKDLAHYIHEARPGSNKKAAMDHQNRVLTHLNALKAFLVPPRG